ncbi:hypothetical protein [Arenibaculum sp.]|uniref:hypothetical protein n=1 Tax=Arenibaculum sp. TaxID=2865862 RepID=UPI002E11B741|nr:hypothetical protein [Arenibaculum sp.]
MAEDKHDKAHDLAEEALDDMVSGDRKKGEKKLDEARGIDPKAVDELGREVEEDRKSAKKHRDDKQK